MNDIFIKYFSITIFTIYTYYKLLHLKKPIFKILCYYFVYVIFICLFIAYFIPFREYFSISFSLVFLFIIIAIISKIHLRLASISYILSYAFNYSIYTFTNLSVLLLVYPFDHNITISPTIQFLAAGGLHFFLLLKIFHTKRLSKGMPFLLNKLSDNSGLLICIITLSCSIILNSSKNTDRIYIPMIVFLLISSAIIICWWRYRLKKLYLEHLKDAEIVRLKEQIQLQDKTICSLEKNNKDLSAIIHKDNKLIPAMELSVRELLTHYINEDKEHCNINAKLLLENLESLSRERAGIMYTYDVIHKTLPPTGILSTDSILSYMSKKAMYHHIQFDLSVSGNIKQKITSVIDSEDLNTLLADFIDNAIIASKKVISGKILICIGNRNGLFQINCYDNGIPFQVDTLLNLGKIPSTTHADEGGSGIGYMTIFQIKKKYKASLYIEIFSEENLFCKNVSMIFDGLGKYIIK